MIRYCLWFVAIFLHTSGHNFASKEKRIGRSSVNRYSGYESKSDQTPTLDTYCSIQLVVLECRCYFVLDWVGLKN